MSESERRRQDVLAGRDPLMSEGMRIAQKWLYPSYTDNKPGTSAMVERGKLAAEIDAAIEVAVERRDIEWMTAVGMYRSGESAPIVTPRQYVRSRRTVQEPARYCSKIDVETGVETPPPETLTEDQAWADHLAELEKRYPYSAAARTGAGTERE